MGCFSKLVKLAFFISFVVGIFIFGGEAISKFFNRDSVSTTEPMAVELTDIQQEDREIEEEARSGVIIFGLISCIFAVILFIYMLYAVFTGKVALVRSTGRNAYSGHTFLIAFILALIMVGFGFLDYKFNEFAGVRAVLTKIGSFK